MLNHSITWLALLAFTLIVGCTSAESRPVVPPEVLPPVVEQVTPAEQVVTLIPESTSTPTFSIATEPPSITSTPAELTLPVIDRFPTLADLGVESATYTDQHAGFALDLPSGWVVTPANTDAYTNSVIYTSFSALSNAATPLPKQQDSLSFGVSKVEVIVFQDQEWTLETAIAERKRQNQQNEMGPTPILSEEDWRLPGGLSGVRWLMEGRDGPVNLLITVIDGRMVLVAGYGDPALFPAVASSLREE